jgi:hypothetical protein
MKKLISLMFVAGMLFTSVAFAEELAPVVGGNEAVKAEIKQHAVSITPLATYHIYSGDLENSLGVGAEVAVRDVFVDNLVLSSGIEFVNSDLPVSGTISGVTVVKKDVVNTSTPFVDSATLNQVIWSNGVGYSLGSILDVKGLDVVPFVSVDSYFVNGDGVSADNSVGFSTGAKATYSVNDRVSLFTALKYSWANTDVTYGNVTKEVDLDNFGLVGGATVQF